jgi:hypothetical protein
MLRAIRDRLVVDSKDVDATLARAARIVSATYRHPYQMHGSVGSSCAVADVRDGKVTLWSASGQVDDFGSLGGLFRDIMNLDPNDEYDFEAGVHPRGGTNPQPARERASFRSQACARRSAGQPAEG